MGSDGEFGRDVWSSAEGPETPKKVASQWTPATRQALDIYCSHTVKAKHGGTHLRHSGAKTREGGLPV